MSDTVGVYICTGCDIGNALDIEQLSKVATDEYKVPVCKTHPFLCGKEGCALIQQDLNEGNVKRIVIAACSSRVNTDVFNFGIDPPAERVNIREHVVWCHPPNNEDTQMIAEDYLRMGIVRGRKVEPIEPFQEAVDKKILVVGGGLAGMTAAIETARAGYEVILVEKLPELGGWLNREFRVLPMSYPFRDMENPPVEQLRKVIDETAGITVFTSSEVEKISGQPGQFDVKIKQEEQRHEQRVGAIVLASGAESYDPANLEELGYGKYANVIAAPELETMAKGAALIRKSDGKQAQSVLFIQCAGSRDSNHLPYCSSTCCLTSLKQALYVREHNPEAKAYIVYKDMRTPGHYEDFYRRVQEDPGVYLTKGEISGIIENEDQSLTVEVENTLIAEKIALKVDLVVLATGMVPTTHVPEKEAREEVETKKDAADKKGDESGPDIHEKGAEILNLAYRLGTDLPQLEYGFPDSHFICFPYETRRTGIYAAGSVRQPMDELTCIDDAMGAALKAIQCVEMISRGETVHPRAGDRTYPDLHLPRCTQCKRCTEECPFGMYDEDEKGTPLPNPTRCRRCGICMGSCPERIISFKDYSIPIVTEMIKAIEVPEEDDEKPRILSLVCENDAYPALDIAGQKHLEYSPYIRFIPLRCVGSMNPVWVADALAAGFDGVLLLGCKSGDDYQCHFITGSELAQKREENIQEKLKQLVLEEERIQFTEIAMSDWGKLPEIINKFAEGIDEVGPNPYKDL